MTSPRAVQFVLVVLLACGPNDAWLQTANGQPGDAHPTDLVVDELAQLRISEAEAALGVTWEELARAQAALQAAERRVERLGEQIQARADSSAVVLATLTRLKRETESYEARMDLYRGSVPMTWVAAALVVTLVGGFLAGMLWLDFLSRRRHGGFRVY